MAAVVYGVVYLGQALIVVALEQERHERTDLIVKRLHIHTQLVERCIDQGELRSFARRGPGDEARKTQIEARQRIKHGLSGRRDNSAGRCIHSQVVGLREREAERAAGIDPEIVGDKALVGINRVIQQRQCASAVHLNIQAPAGAVRHFACYSGEIADVEGIVTGSSSAAKVDIACHRCRILGCPAQRECVGAVSEQDIARHNAGVDKRNVLGRDAQVDGTGNLAVIVERGRKRKDRSRIVDEIQRARFVVNGVSAQPGDRGVGRAGNGRNRSRIDDGSEIAIQVHMNCFSRPADRTREIRVDETTAGLI